MAAYAAYGISDRKRNLKIHSFIHMFNAEQLSLHIRVNRQLFYFLLRMTEVHLWKET